METKSSLLQQKKICKNDRENFCQAHSTKYYSGKEAKKYIFLCTIYIDKYCWQ